jgi:long-chain acyl-CoA synthetase
MSGTSVSAPPSLGSPGTLVDVLERSLAHHGDRPLFLTKQDGAWRELSYRAFGVLVDEVRGGLAGLGVAAGDRVGIIANNRVEWAAIAYACYGLGAALVPMYESQQDKEWAFIARDAGCKLLFAGNRSIHDKLAPLVGNLPGLSRVGLLDPAPAGAADDGILRFPQLVAAGRRQPVPARRPSPTQTACLLYTSGTTGEPKGVVLSHANVCSNLEALYQVIPLAIDHRTLSFLPWAHAFGHTVELHMILASGASTAIAESVDRLVANFAEVRPTVLVAVPRVFLKIYAGVEKLMADKPRLIQALYRRGLALASRRAQGQRLGPGGALVRWLADRMILGRIRARFGGRLQFAVSGAAALAREVAEFMEALGISIYEGYGLTETSPIVTANVPGRRKLGSVGRPLPGVQVVIDRSRGTSEDEGEIVVHGPNVMVGYHQREADNREIFTSTASVGHRGVRTGDLGRLDADGYLFITGRIKEQYKLENGKYVAPAPLEERLKLSPLIANVLVYGDNRSFNVALVVPQIEALRALAHRAGFTASTDQALRAHPAIRQAVRVEIDRLSAEWKGYERVREFTLLPEDFTQENGMLTPSLKLRRHNVVARWRPQIEALYAARTPRPGDGDGEGDGLLSAGGL